MPPFDAPISQWVNSFVGLHPAIDAILIEVSENTLVKGSVPMAMAWALWFRRDAASAQRRTALLGVITAGFFAVLVARGCSLLMPFHVRPMHEPSLGLHIPSGLTRDAFDGWSSLPSDNASFFFAIAVGLWRICPQLGPLAFAHAVLVVALPRLALGVHYASDLVAGAIIGVASTLLCSADWLGTHLYSRGLRFEADQPQWFYATMFLVTAETADLLLPVRQLAHVAVHSIRILLH